MFYRITKLKYNINFMLLAKNKNSHRREFGFYINTIIQIVYNCAEIFTET